MITDFKPKFFASTAALRQWFAQHHSTKREVWIGFYKKTSGRTGLGYQEVLDQALCFGWIDGIMKSLDEISYANRFTPRKPRSNWTETNIRRAEQLIADGLMEPAGLAVFDARSKVLSAPSSGQPEKLDEAYEKRLRQNKKAWAFFESETPSYRRNASRWVMSAKREETRLKRLGTLIEDSANGLRIRELRREKK